MKSLLLVIILAAWSTIAHAQLDHILEPIADAPVNATADQSLGDSNNTDMAAVASGAPLTVKTVRNLSADDLQSELQKQLTAYFGLKGDLKLSFIQQWRPVPLPGKDCDITLTDYPADGVTSAFNVTFKVVSGGILVGEWQIDLRAQLWQSVWLAQSRLERGQSLDRSMLNDQKIDVLRNPQSYLSDDINPEGYDVAQGVAAGHAIAKEDVIERPVIHRGDLVDVVATEGMLDIRMKALALEDGGINSLIKMRNLDSNKEFDAQILNENEVKVHF
jgi:flagella basal body P-ring formation protein FlgA